MLVELGITGGVAISAGSAGTLSPVGVGVAAAAVAAGSAVSISGVVDITAGISMIVSNSSGGSDGGDNRHTPDQEALTKLAKEAKQQGGVNQTDAETLVEWGKEIDLPSRGPEIHPNRPFGQFPHIHIGPVDHIPLSP